jgi:hypothetical protein
MLRSSTRAALSALILLAAACGAVAATAADAASADQLRVSADHHRLEHADGRPFFYLADTDWELFHRASRDDAELLLQDRAKKGFTAIQAVVLAEYGGLTEPNANGDLPLLENDPTRPNEAYFAHVDWIVARANALGLVIAMLPTWGDKWNKAWGMGPEIFTPENARAYGEMLGKRYRDAQLIWILGGDRDVVTDRHRAILRAMAEGLAAGDGGRHLRTLHPCGQHTSAQWFHDDAWLDFNMCQSGHSRDRDNYNTIAKDYARTPAKPCLDGEPGYEDHPNQFKPERGWLEATDTRKFAWWAVLSGACGHTYGCHDIWQMWQPGRKPVTFARTPWKEALSLPGSTQVGYVRALIESGPFFDRVPDQSLVASANPDGGTHVAACRAPDGHFALLYIPDGRPVTVRTAALGKQLRMRWFDPRGGQSGAPAALAGGDDAVMTPPGAGMDWVLVIERM